VLVNAVSWGPCLHRYDSVINQDLFRKEVGTDCCLVACAELLVDLVVNPALARDVTIKTRSAASRATNILVH
jgi:hypothetical protein